MLSCDDQHRLGAAASLQPQSEGDRESAESPVAAQPRPPAGPQRTHSSGTAWSGAYPVGAGRASAAGGEAEGGSAYLYLADGRAVDPETGELVAGMGSASSREECEQFSQGLPRAEKPRIRERWRLADGLRDYQAARVAKCRRIPVSETVPVQRGVHGHHYGATCTCSSVWCCPHCAPIILAERGADIERVVSTWGPGRTVMLTLTARHSLEHDLAGLLKGTMAAWASLQQSGAWRRWLASMGYAGYVRRIDMTQGENGWHVHLHLLLFLGDGVELDASNLTEDGIASHWAAAVARKMGSQHVPSDDRGVRLTPCNSPKYLAKMGFEFTDSGTKQAKNGNRTVWELARDIADRDDAHDVSLWREYAEATKGKRMVEWSRGDRDMRKRLALADERADADIIADAEAGELVGLLPAMAYRRLVQLRQVVTPLEMLDAKVSWADVAAWVERVTGHGVRPVLAAEHAEPRCARAPPM